MIRLGIFTHALSSGGRTGKGRYVDELIRGVKTFQDIELVLLYYQKSELTLHPYCEAIHLPRYSLPKFPPMAIAPMLLRKYNLTLIHYPSDGISPIVHYCDKVLYTCHGVAPCLLPRSVHKRMNPLIYFTLAHRHQHIRKIITPSQSSKNEICRIFSIPPKKVIAIHHGVDTNFFHSLPSSAVNKYLNSLNINSPYLLHVSNFQPMKNVVRLIKAFANISKKYPIFKLVIAGDRGWKFHQVLNQISREKLNDKVLIIGPQNKEILRALYNGAVFFVFPSLWESFGFPVLEAMACGTPVLISKINALQEVTGNIAVTVNPFSENSITSGMEKLINDSKLRAKLSLQGLKRAAQFSWQTSVLKHYQCYQEVCFEG